MNVSELEGAELDAAVARCEGWVGASAELGPLFGFPTKWEHGGPIIEREGIAVFQDTHGWKASTDFDLRDLGEMMTGPTPLIAAMRAYVASKHKS